MCSSGTTDQPITFSPEDRVKGYRRVYEAIAAHHPALVPLFGTGAGHHLQFLESQLMVNVLLELAERGIVGLPIHDGVIVQGSRAERVCSIMEHRALRMLSLSIPVGIKGRGSEPGKDGDGQAAGLREAV